MIVEDFHETVSKFPLRTTLQFFARIFYNLSSSNFWKRVAFSLLIFTTFAVCLIGLKFNNKNLGNFTIIFCP